MTTDICSGQEADLLKYVNPLIGTDKMGHTYPGATVPFGMVQLSPDTDTLPYEVNGAYNRDVINTAPDTSMKTGQLSDSPIHISVAQATLTLGISF